jgi:MFS family permease
VSAYTAFRFRDFRLLLTASGFANMGLQMLSVAVSWDLYVQTRSAAVLGSVGLVQVIPTLVFALFAGQLADRIDRRRVLLLTQAATVLASALLVFGPRSVAMIYGVLFVLATARTFQWSARAAILGDVVPLEAISNAVTWNSTVMEVASMGGPALAGLLIASFSSDAVYRTQLCFAILVAICQALLRIRKQPSFGKAAGGLSALLEGINFVRRTPLVLAAASLDLFAVLFGGAVALLPIFAADILRAGPQALGWMRAAPSVGAITMALVQAHSPRFRHPGRVLLWSVAGFGAATVVFGLSRNLWLSLLMLALTGTFDNISVVLRQSLLQLRTPSDVRGRVMAVNGVFIQCSNQLGAAESGWTAAWWGSVPSVVFGGAAAMAVVCVFALRSPLKDWEQ